MTVLKYPGSKQSISQSIISLFPSEYRRLTYLEPFFGSGAVFFNKARSKIETINDMDSDVYNFFLQLRDSPEELARLIELTPWHREEFRKAYEKTTTVQDKTRGYLKSDFRGINKCNANQYHKRKSDVNKHNTIFGQLLGLVNRSEFDLTSTVGEKLSKQMSADKYSKGFTAWTHFCSMVFAQVSRQLGLRSIENALNQQSRNFYHLGIKSAGIKRSTLSYANNNRSADFFQALFYRLLNSQNNVKEKQFPFNNQLYAVDATTIDLCLKLFPWATFRTTKGGIKLHTQYDIKKQIPTYVLISNAKKHENTTLQDMPLHSGDIVTFDRGYTNYTQFARFCQQKIFFVTRLKENADFVVEENLLAPADTSESAFIQSDQIIRFNGIQTGKNCPLPLRKIVSVDKKTGKSITILTNIASNHLDALTIAAIYRNRWQIELFFKAMKQNLKIKRSGNSENAVRTQIWIAPCVSLIFSAQKNIKSLP